MKLVEHRGKELLRSCGIRVPPGIVTDNRSYVNLSYHKKKYHQFFLDHKDVMIKAQVVGGGRGKQGLVVHSKDYKESLGKIEELYGKTYNDAPITSLLIEKTMPNEEEYFLAIIYDTKTRNPMVMFSLKGGVDIEEQAKPITKPFSLSEGLHDYQAREIAKEAGFKGGMLLQVAALIKDCYNCFDKYDCTHLEINPVIKTPDGVLVAGDAKITIDDSALGRQDAFHDVTDIEDKSFLSELELAARKIDYNDHRGVAGKTFVELDGNIAVLASGGGASLTAMDTIIEAGGNPANYTEYSGNPPREKVVKLTEVTLSKKGLKGCLVIGGKANFTDIYDTLAGFMEVVKKLKPKYPIVIRRAGPRDKEAFEMVRKIADEEGLDITLFGEETPMSKAAYIMVQKVQG